ncbi:MAG: nitroreductase family protein [Candidatus Aminicenantaceae bacterium]
MSFYELIISRRSIRQFKAQSVSKNTLKKLVNAARLAPSGANLQPLEFVVVDKVITGKAIFKCLKWAAYITPEGNPKPGHEPAAYVIVLVNTRIRDKDYEHDSGAAIENMILAAWEEGIGSCWLTSVKRKIIREILNVPPEYKVDSVVALGYPDEEPAVEEIKDSIKYWKDRAGRLHVPKRKLENIIHFNKF